MGLYITYLSMLPRRLVPTCNNLRSWRRGCSLVPSFWSRQMPAIRVGCIGKSIKKIYSWFAWYVASVESYSSFGASICCTSHTASLAGESAFARWECGVKEASLLRRAVCVLLRIELPYLLSVLSEQFFCHWKETIWSRMGLKEGMLASRSHVKML